MRNKMLYYFIFCLNIGGGCKESEVAPVKTKDLIPHHHLLPGNPSNATTDEANPNNYWLHKPQYSLSYSRDRGTPNWVSWHVNKDWVGTTSRQDDFRIDNTLPADWHRVSPTAFYYKQQGKHQ